MGRRNQMAPANLSQVLRTGRGAETNQRLNGLRLRGYTRDHRHKRTEPDCGRVAANPDITPFSSSVRIVRHPARTPEFALKMLEESFGDFAISDRGLSRTVAISY
jgi:hypothetical protein